MCFDPTRVYSGECRLCGVHCPDTEEMDDGRCWSCTEIEEAAEREEQAQFDLDNDTYPFRADEPSWFAIAADIARGY